MLCPVILVFLLVVNKICQVSSQQALSSGKTLLLGGSEEAEAALRNTIKGRGVSNDEKVEPKFGGLSGLSGLAGLPGVWWPGSHVISSWSSLLAAGLSSVAIGAAVIPAMRRSDSVEDRVFRGVEAEPYSWPWIAKLKTTFRKPGARVRKRACGGALIADRFEEDKSSLR